MRRREVLRLPCICMPPKARRAIATFNAQLGGHDLDQVGNGLVATHLTALLALLPLPLLALALSTSAFAWFHLFRFAGLLVSK